MKLRVGSEVIKGGKTVRKVDVNEVMEQLEEPTQVFAAACVYNMGVVVPSSLAPLSGRYRCSQGRSRARNM